MLPNGRKYALRRFRLAGRSVLREFPRSFVARAHRCLEKRALFFVLAAAALLAQPPARPQFDVASIKPSQERGTMYVRALPGGRLLVNAPARLMLMNAYGLQFSQLAGAPDWLSSEIWSVDARAEGNRTRDELMLMLQSLLEERFHLKFHRESREMPVYADRKSVV